MKFAISFEIFFDFFEKNFSNINREDIAAGLQKHTEDLITLLNPLTFLEVFSRTSKSKKIFFYLVHWMTNCLGAAIAKLKF